MPVVLISRGTMSGGTRLAECLSERLGIRSVSREDLVSVIDARGDTARRVVETVGHATRAYEHFSRLRRPYIFLMRYALLELIREGPLVYHGHSGHLLVPGLPCCLRVRVNAPMEMRVKNAMQRLALPEAKAKEAVLEEDEGRVRWGRFLYGKDIRDPSLYDVCFSLERMTIPSVCSMIAGALEEPQFTPTDETQVALDELFLATAVEAALADAPSTSEIEVSARAKGGQVQIEGPWLSEEKREEVLRIAGEVPGVTGAEYQPGCASVFDLVL